MVTVLGVLAALAFGFVFGRIWQIRRDELERRASFTPPSVARIPRPSGAEVSGQVSASAARCRSTTDNRPDQSGTADLFAKSTAATSSRRETNAISVPQSR